MSGHSRDTKLIDKNSSLAPALSRNLLTSAAQTSSKHSLSAAKSPRKH